MSGSHRAVGVGDARARHGVPRGLLQLHRVLGRAHQRRPIRDARRSGVLSAPLRGGGGGGGTTVRGAPTAAVRRRGQQRATAADPAAAAVPVATVADDAVVRAPATAALAVRGVQIVGSRVAGAGRRVLQWRRIRATGAGPTPAKGPAQEAQTQRLGRHGRQYG